MAIKLKKKKNIVKGAREPRYRDSKSVRGSQDHQAFQIKGGAGRGGTIVKGGKGTDPQLIKYAGGKKYAYKSKIGKVPMREVKVKDSRFGEDVDKRWDAEDEKRWKERERRKLKKKGRLISRY